MEFTNPENGYTETPGGGLSWLWVFLFGPIYWAIKGVWRHAVVHLVLALITFGAAHFVYPFSRIQSYANTILNPVGNPR